MATSTLALQSPPRLRGIPSAEEAAVAVSGERLLVVGMMTSRRCNLQCTYCYTDAGSERVGELGLMDRVRVLREAAGLGARLLWIPGEGEPLMDKAFWGMLEEAKRLGLWTLFYTSGSLVNPEFVRRLADLPCSIVVKVNSLQHDVQDKLAGIPGTGAKIRRGIDLLLAAGFADGRLGGETVILPDNADEIPAIFRFCRRLNIVPYIERLLPTGRGECASLQLTGPHEDNIFRELARMDREEFGFDWAPVGTFAAGLWSCDRILHTLVVDATGLIHPCVAIRDAFGDARHHSLASIWNGPTLKAFRHSLVPSTGRGICFCRESLRQNAEKIGSEPVQIEPSITNVETTAPDRVQQQPTFVQPLAKGMKYLNYSVEDVKRYDRNVQALVPGYAQMLTTIAKHLAARIVNGQIVDLGAGTGNLVQVLLSALPKMEFRLLDFSVAMCQKAREKFEPEPRCVVENRDVAALGERKGYAAVISTLLLHEYSNDRLRRLKLVESMFASLGRNGDIIIADYYRPATALQRTQWIDQIRAHARLSEVDPTEVAREVEEHLFDSFMPCVDEEFKSIEESLGRRPRLLLSSANLFVWCLQK